MNNATPKDTVVEAPVRNPGEEFDALMADYTNAVGAEAYLREWCPGAYASAIADAVAAGHGLLAAVSDAGMLGETAHKNARVERFDSIDDRIDKYIAVAERLKTIRALGALAVEIKQDAIRLGKEVDAAMDENTDTATTKARALGWAPADNDEEK